MANIIRTLVELHTGPWN